MKKFLLNPRKRQCIGTRKENHTKIQYWKIAKAVFFWIVEKHKEYINIANVISEHKGNGKPNECARILKLHNP